MKVFIILAVSIASLAGTTLGSQQATTDGKKTVDKRSLWQLGTFFSGFGDSLARSDGAHGHGHVASFSVPEHHSGGGWHQEYQPQPHQQQQQHHHHVHQWDQVQAVQEHEPKSSPVHEWHADQGLQGHTQHHFDEQVSQPQHHQHFGGSFEQGKVEQPSFDWHHQQVRVEDSGNGWQQQLHGSLGSSSQEWQHDESAKESDAGESHGGDWAPIAGAGSSDLHKEHLVKSISSETKEHQHQEWSPAEGKEHHHEEHHHTKIIKVPYPVHIEKPYPVYIEKPFIVEKPVPLKLYIKKKHH